MSFAFSTVITGRFRIVYFGVFCCFVSRLVLLLHNKYNILARRFLQIVVQMFSITIIKNLEKLIKLPSETQTDKN